MRGSKRKNEHRAGVATPKVRAFRGVARYLFAVPTAAEALGGAHGTSVAMEMRE
jgi:hypothetical protein